MLKQSKVLALVLVFALILSSFTFAAPKEVSNTKSAVAFDQKILSRIDGRKALETIKYLSETIGPRIAGTVEEKEAAKYIENEFKKMGYSVKNQEFDINNVIPYVTIDSLGNKVLMVNAAIGSGYTDGKGVTEELVNCGLGANASDFPADVAGKIAFVQRGAVSFAIKAENAVNAGAAGVIMYNNQSGSLNPTLGTYNCPIPYVSISLEDGNMIVEAMKQNPVIVTVKAELKTKSQNIIATTTPQSNKKATDAIIYVTAHYDSVPYAPGANDNASGIAMMLQFAKILKGYNLDKEVRFIACGAEEIGVHGSNAYVNSLSQDEIERSLGVFNMDMVATSDEGCTILEVNTVDGKDNYITDLSVAAGARLGNLTEIENITGISSDHRYFGYKGIPHGGFIWRADDGRPAPYLEPWYHTPNDTIAMNISVEKYEKAGEIIGSALYEAIRKPTPSLEKSAVRAPQLPKMEAAE